MTDTLAFISSWLHVKSSSNDDNDYGICFCIVVKETLSICSNELQEDIFLQAKIANIRETKLNEFTNTVSFHVYSNEVLEYRKTENHNIIHEIENQNDFNQNSKFDNNIISDNGSIILYEFECSNLQQAEKWRVALTPHKVPKFKPMSISDFQIVKKIGCGYSGEVLLAKYSKVGQYFALKSIPKENVYRSKRATRAVSERNILMQASHPFITRLVSTFQSDSRLFLVLEFVKGGDLAFNLARGIHLDTESARLYIAEIATALSYLHKMGIMFRDLKPSNILIGEDGHLKLTDFGLARYLIDTDAWSTSCTSNLTQNIASSNTNSSNTSNNGNCAVTSKVNTINTSENNKDDDNCLKNNNQTVCGCCSTSLCGTSEYLAPEMIQQQGYTFAVDWWALGVLAYQLYEGILPFRSINLARLYNQILSQPVKFFKRLPDDVKDFIKRLLEKDPKSRLGCGPLGESEIFDHPFFNGLDWDAVYNKKYEPLYKPYDTCCDVDANFDKNITCQKPESCKVGNCNVEDHEMMHVKGFSFMNIEELSTIIAKENISPNVEIVK